MRPSTRSPVARPPDIRKYLTVSLRLPKVDYFLVGLILMVALALPFSPLGAWFGFVPPPAPVLIATGAIVVA